MHYQCLWLLTLRKGLSTPWMALTGLTLMLLRILAAIDE